MKRASLGACLLLSSLFAGCKAPPPGPWRVEVAGCETWAAGQACAIGKEKLRIWVGGAEPFAVELDGEKLLLQPKPLAGGQRFELPVPSTAGKLRLVRANIDPFELSFSPSQRPASYAEIRSVYQETDEVERRVGRLAEGKAGELNGELAWKRYFEARLAHRRGDRLKAVELSARSAELWSEPLPGYALTELVFATQMLSDEARFDQAQQKLADAVQMLERMQARGLVPWRSAFLVADQQANLALATGDVRSALAHWEKLDAAVARGVLSPGEAFSIGNLEVRILAELGRFDEALARLEKLADADLDPDLEAHRLHNCGAVALLAKMAGQPVADPAPFLQRAWDQYYEKEGSGNEKLIARLAQAWAELVGGRPAAARGHLAAAKDLLGFGGAAEQFDFKEIEAQLLLAEGNAQASLEIFQQLDEEASERQLPGASWRALVGKAQAMAAAGSRAAAIESFERAERLEGRELTLIPIDKGRETFLARREGATRQHLSLLLEEGRQADAYQLARRHRARTLRLLHRDERLAALNPEQRGNWNRAVAEYRRRLSEREAEVDRVDAERPRQSRRLDPQPAQGGDELAQRLDRALVELGLPPAAATLPPPRQGELNLAFFPLEDSWLLFAESGPGQVRVETSRQKKLEDAAAELLGRVLPEIEQSSRLKLLPWGDLDLHGILVGGRPLVAFRPIAYGLDAGFPAPDAPPQPAAGGPAGPGKVLLVGDTLSLRRPKSELEMAGRILAARGFEVGDPLLGENAKAPQVRQEIENADYFHFAGHSIFDPKAGSQSRLSLHGGELKASDVFTLSRVPRLVLLSSCSGGQASRAAGVEGLGLAQAFVLAGSRQVLATTREVDDREAADLIDALYRHLGTGGGEMDLAAALQRAQVERSQAKVGSDWQAFRVFEP
jgi:tetratricopeptide (TPR) repeat protein